MCIKRLFFVAILMLSPLVAQGAIADTLEHANMVKRANDIVTKIVAIAYERANTNENYGSGRDEVRAKLSYIFSLENDPHTLVRVAMVIWLYRSEYIEDIANDVFMIAEDLALFRVKEIGGDKALDALEYLQSRGNLDGGRAFMVDHLIYKLISTKKPRKLPE
jgi:hypothetical protein